MDFITWILKSTHISSNMYNLAIALILTIIHAIYLSFIKPNVYKQAITQIIHDGWTFDSMDDAEKTQAYRSNEFLLVPHPQQNIPLKFFDIFLLNAVFLFPPTSVYYPSLIVWICVSAHFYVLCLTRFNE